MVLPPSPPLLSVVLCTHNPRADYLQRTLLALRAQSLPAPRWELLLVDNASREPVRSRFDLAWHPYARVVEETEIGLTAARLRGIAETSAPLLVWVDDDNLLAPDYLEKTIRLSNAWPHLGVWGCGHFSPEWETPPGPEVAEYLGYLAVHRAARDRWSNRLFDYEATPAGAGLCVRAPVAQRYAENVRTDVRRKRLGRTGADLGGCEDFDLAFTAIALGYGIGVFTELALTHLMPRGRVEESYLLRLVEGHAFSTVLLHAWHDPGFQPRPAGALARLRAWRYRRTLTPAGRRIHDARLRGESRAFAALAHPEA
jgi:glycosyltransferase involved in cell wall biosynthesis